MNFLNENRARIQKMMADAVSQVSSGFAEISSGVKSLPGADVLRKRVDALFHLVLELNRNLSGEITRLAAEEEKHSQTLSRITEEKERLETLYASGILFSSETGVRPLMQKAIDVVVKELRADEGFIVLVNEDGSPQEIFSRNMNLDDHPEAREMSFSVIRATIARSRPLMDTADAQTEFSKQNSVLRLGITAVLCVPLVSQRKVLGAVYLDRRNRQAAFTEPDLVFLLSFGRQIVQGLETSLEISSLQSKLVSEISLKFSDLRKDFDCADIIGSSRKLFDIVKICAKISSTDAPVLLLGENGTGKDLLARAIHRNSRRREKPFVTINCGAIPADLLESELFGYESGAFTGATKSKPGKLETADSGTVFLDEIADLSVNLQAKLLRSIQSKEVERLGALGPKSLDVRFLAATNRNIGEMIEAGSFREDLYYRLKVIELVMPPLRERKEDIHELAQFFMKKYAQNGAAFNMSEEALGVLEHYSWPGNVRELENVIHRALILAKDSTLTPADLPLELIEEASNDPQVVLGKSLLDAEKDFRRQYIIKTLRQAGSAADAARQLGINRTHFYKLLSQLEIEL